METVLRIGGGINMKNIYIVRHGESQGNARHIKESDGYVIDMNVELTELGMCQAAYAGANLNNHLKSKNGVFWVSPFKRTRCTADYIKCNLNSKYRRNYDYVEDPRLVEQDFGDFDFQFFEKWKDISPHSYFINQARYNDENGRFFARLENGESMLDVYNRVSLFVKTRLETSNYKENIIVTHGCTSRALIMFLLGMNVEEYYTMDVPGNASIRHIAYKNGKYIDKGYIYQYEDI